MPAHISVILDKKEVIELIASCDNILYKVRLLNYSSTITCDFPRLDTWTLSTLVDEIVGYVLLRTASKFCCINSLPESFLYTTSQKMVENLSRNTLYEYVSLLCFIVIIIIVISIYFIAFRFVRAILCKLYFDWLIKIERYL